MKKLYSKTAISLLELIITCMLVAIVVLGIFAINNVLNNNNQDYGQRYFVKSETQSTLTHILNNAAFAIGSGTNMTQGGQQDIGFINGLVGTVQEQTFCIHQDIPYPAPGYTTDNAPANNPPSSPPYYIGSRWLCYTQYISGTVIGGVDKSYQVYYCPIAYNGSLANQGAGSCYGNPNAEFLGTAYTLNSSYDSATNTIVVNIQNCLNNEVNCGLEPVNNPQITLTGRITPSQQAQALPQ